MSDIGKKLKDARNEKHYTLDDLQQITKIQKRYLIAIEENDFDALPGNFYVRAFIRQYADTVGVKSDDILSELDEITGEKQATNQVAEPEVTSRTQAIRQQGGDVEKNNEILEKIMHYLPTIIIVAVVAVILGSIYFVSSGNRKQAEQASSTPSVSVTTDESTSEKKSSSQKVKKASSSEEASTKGATNQKITHESTSGSNFTYALTGASKDVKLKFSSNGSSWSSVSVNGTATWQGTLEDGASKTVTIPEGTKSFMINLGNSKATTLTINGKKFNFLKDNSSLTVRRITVNIAE
ncbi:transcriptional regulator [Ligilactobacillus hayakitensis DSM 18933 = JCM 14209]|uniref:Transcriptional regulator n=1 Tax=Ligilactobacillus hayakitensis DSM 18933 = JCM 14209 TaxID=1423755 RepID=A0A0R1WMJ9_9LACO|nr:RodZ domain-containing protein [Ligilactobacillus hayakitensis]KRM19130.1 transcriptional regulator [Ligilactobacillus hayakitensis DSM 18933 = JCM 14209]